MIIIDGGTFQNNHITLFFSFTFTLKTGTGLRHWLLVTFYCVGFEPGNPEIIFSLSLGLAEVGKYNLLIHPFRRQSRGVALRSVQIPKQEREKKGGDSNTRKGFYNTFYSREKLRHRFFFLEKYYQNETSHLFHKCLTGNEITPRRNSRLEKLS